MDRESNGATLSLDGLYRYRLWRTLPAGLLPLPERRILFVLLNPSKADATVPDPTLTRCLGFAARDGYTRLDIVNLFAYRTKSPAVLKETAKYGINVVGPDNDDHIRAAADGAERIVVGWGNNHFGERVGQVTRLLAGRVLQCFGRTKAGHPLHPLYLRSDTPLVTW